MAGGGVPRSRTWRRRRACPAARCPGCSTAGHYVSPVTLDTVNRAIKKTGYVVNHHARSLVTQRSESVAFILSEPDRAAVRRPELRGPAARLHAGARRARHRAVRLHRRVPLGARPGSPASSPPGHVDGALLVSAHAGDPLLGLLGTAGVPYVACGAPLGYESAISYVAADERGGARAMVEYLRSAGRTRIATITGPLDTSGGRGRLEGYRDVVGGVVRRVPRRGGRLLAGLR